MKIDKLFSRYVLVSIAAFLAVACNNDNEASIAGDSGIVNITGQVATKIETRATAEDFEIGDVIGLYAMVWNDASPSTSVALDKSTLYTDNSSMSWNGTNFDYTVENKILYWPSLKRNLDLYAYYPYMDESKLEDTGSLLPVSVLTDQSAEGALTRSDVMTARMLGVAKTSGIVSLPFQHALSKLKITLVAGSGYQDSDFEEVTINLVNVMTATRIDLAKVPDDEGYSGDATVPVEKLTTLSGEAIIVPQVIAQDAVFIEILDREGSKMAEVKAVEGKNVFVSSNQYNIAITLNKTGAGITADISEWVVEASFSPTVDQVLVSTEDVGGLNDTNVAFADGNEIGLFATKWETATNAGNISSYLVNHKLTYNHTDAIFTGEPVYWPTAWRKLNFYAYAPWTDGKVMTGTSIPVSVNEDQSGDTPTADWLISRQEAVASTSGKVIFNFTHVLSKIKVILEYGEGYTDGTTVFDPITAPTVQLVNTFIEANVDMKDATVTPIGVETPIRLKKNELEFTGSLISQTVAAGKELLMIYDNEGKLAASLKLAENKIFQSGVEYKLIVTLRKSDLGFTADISKWISEDWTGEAGQEWGAN